MEISDKRAHSRHSKYVCISARKIRGACTPREAREITEMPDTSFFIGSMLEASVSENGIGFMTETEYMVGDRVEVSIQFHDKHNGFAAVICGEVRWARPVTDGVYEAGVQFINITDGLRKRISEFIRSEA